ncbi:MAG TPA: hypothetical protein VIB11_03220 [Pedococcus sp.]|uniref:hypothetical protein n=1 Tax=Pedococcus sp. TaxID=2860345 RepID=UPI002F9566AE
MAEDYVKLRLRFRESDDLPEAEGMWAEPVHAHDGGGTYRLANSSFFVPLATGDTVRAAVDGHGSLQIVDIVAPCDRVLTVTEHTDQVTDEEVQRIADAWTEGTDGWTEGTNGLLYTIWPEGMGLEQISDVLRRSIGRSRAWTWHATALPADRVREQHSEIDFDLDTTAPAEFVTDYWAPEDPEWAARGITDPERLAFIQSLASEDPRVAVTLKNGRHDNVLRYIERLTADDPRALPPLDGPLLDEV